jgi:hypothetical protein
VARRTLFFIAVAASVPAALVVACLVGHYAAVPPAQFDWNAAAGAGTAAGTLALAIVTGVLVVLANEDVQLMRRLESERHRPTLVIRNRAMAGALREEYASSLALRPGFRLKARRPSIAPSGARETTRA